MCDCNKSSPNSENWDRTYKKQKDTGCTCCCTSGKSKVKGKFGVAYIIETPDRKCKPCGWEVEFNDTPSTIENNCRKMMNWISCPPLGGCKNNDTNLCCSSNPPKGILDGIQEMCNPSSGQNACCCGNKNNSSGGDCCCCCKKPNQTNGHVCYNESTNNRCCHGQNNKQNRLKNEKSQCCCTKPKGNRCCTASKGRDVYLKSKNKYDICHCSTYQNDKQPCCCTRNKDYHNNGCGCKTITVTPEYCCQSDSESSISYCEFCSNRNSKKECDCNCNCSECKCSRNLKSKSKQSKDKNNKVKKSTSQKKSREEPSKNLLSPSSNEKNHKVIEKSRFTISSNIVPKKDPDKDYFHDDYSPTTSKESKPEMMDLQAIENLDDLKQTEIEINSTQYDEIVPRMKPEKGPQQKSNTFEEDETKEEKQQENTKLENINTTKSKSRLLSKNKEEIKEPFILENNQNDKLGEKINKQNDPERSNRKMLKKLKNHKKTDEPNQFPQKQQAIIEESREELNKFPEDKIKQEKQQENVKPQKIYKGGTTLLTKIKRKHEQEMEAIHG